MTARRPKPKVNSNPNSATSIYDAVKADLGLTHDSRDKPAVVLADAMLPSLAQLEPLP